MSEVESVEMFITIDTNDLVKILSRLNGHGFKIKFSTTLTHELLPPATISIDSVDGESQAKVTFFEGLTKD